MTVYIVGAGVAGLLVARDLARAGRDVVVLEGSDRVGGQLEATRLDGRAVDLGAESFATRGDAVATLLGDLGLTASITPPLAAPAWVVDGAGTPRSLPAAAVLGIPAAPLARDVVAALGWWGALRTACDAVLPRTAITPTTTLGDLVRARMGARALERLVDPVVRGVYSSPACAIALTTASPPLAAELASTRRLAVAASRVRASSPAGSQVAGLDGGLTGLVDALHSDLLAHGGEVRLGVEVTAASSDAVTIATPAGPVELTGTVVVAAPALATAVRTQRTITVVAAAVRSAELAAAPRGTGVLVAAGAPGTTARALTHSSAKWPWLAPRSGVHLVRLSYDAPPPPEAIEGDVRLLTGVSDAVVIEQVRRTWIRTIAVDPPPAGGPTVVGEASGRSGLAAIVTHARLEAERLIHETTPHEGVLR